MLKKSFKIALCQLSVTSNKSQNIQHAISAIQSATQAPHSADLVVLPECFNSPYGTKYFPEYAEPFSDSNGIESSETLQAIAKCAKDNNVYVIAGSIPTLDNGKYYNTSTVFSDNGSLVAVHRKVHLFDIDIPGKITFKESDILSPGKNLTHFDMIRNGAKARIGLGICFDVRFAEMAQILASTYKCDMMVYPGAFNMTTGPAHWELLARARAVDNQFWVAMCSPARDAGAEYVAWGHSLLVSPWGEVVTQAQEGETIVSHQVNLTQNEEIRSQIPVMSAKGDKYKVSENGDSHQENNESSGPTFMKYRKFIYVGIFMAAAYQYWSKTRHE
uniref:CN hydrolase domain-containing protein n=1 Tax=Percolomonas cosmopolitus TaxID=63605 RepID=A0A7S1KUP4_9EUKA|mmetsp:Transcript_9767/g.36407  ORF Transcript_9767/g.36407 Transcript_9767/m.36407 type:complete len:331 (+) Transcript_9767:49-1041(+)|eukprot:CAMPEP_0117448080 /NCGR_PEP_ID=MMETSP0759-20121206/7211_1 /TAXON_ID=63605 /ORGANISM="Percolomonas cosmopolitus, Strain WS" /LENGTH=330 /DNA_ID=CAMNT_0005240445 /DNA_START=30 /DNA_END=1022 /DNA_ORIENTATION=-